MGSNPVIMSLVEADHALYAEIMLQLKKLFDVKVCTCVDM